MSTSFALALSAAHDAAAGQHYPQAALYLVATPIGNLADITLRALHVLQLVDAIACEDTRHTQAMLRAYGIDRPTTSLLALHQHNEAQGAQQVVQRLQQGQRVAYVSDAGTPGVSDPGARLAAAVQAEGLRCIPLPGASSVTTALSAAGVVPPTAHQAGFVFEGFLPARGAERSAALQRLARESRCVILLEAPHRIRELALALAPLGTRCVTLARELTKQFEELSTHPAQTLTSWLDGAPQRTRGEFVVLLHPTEPQGDQHQLQGLEVLRQLLPELPTRAAVKLAAQLTGASRNELYAAALQMKTEAGD